MLIIVNIFNIMFTVYIDNMLVIIIYTYTYMILYVNKGFCDICRKMTAPESPE